MTTDHQAQPHELQRALAQAARLEPAIIEQERLAAALDRVRTTLVDTENYLSALHGSVAQHDHLAANLGCAGCELRERITDVRRSLTQTADRTAEQQPFPQPFRLRLRHGQVLHGVVLPGGPALVVDDADTGLATFAEDTDQLLAGYGGGRIEMA